LSNKAFLKLINDIPQNKWEECLAIGNFFSLRIERMLERKFSVVAKCKIKGQSDFSVVYIKYYKNFYKRSKNELTKIIERDFQDLNYWYAKFKCSDQFNVVKPLFILADQSMLVTKEVAGEDLHQLLVDFDWLFASRKNFQQLRHQIHNAGAWLHYFHSIQPRGDEIYSIDDLVEYLDVRLKILTEENKRHFPKIYQKKIHQYIQKHRRLVSEMELEVNLSHSDFNPGNIIVNGDSVTVLDFGKVRKESFLLDASRFYHQLYLMTFKPNIRQKMIRKLQMTLLEGFGKPGADQLTIFKFLLIRHTLTHLVGITRFWQKKLQERIYNYWVLYNELKFLDSFLDEN
jgi:serine/threonine protein kinase